MSDLHARATAGWKGKAAAAIAQIGFASLIFNFVGINYFFGSGSLSSYSGRWTGSASTRELDATGRRTLDSAWPTAYALLSNLVDL